MHGKKGADTDMDSDLTEWGQLMKREAVPERLRELATRLRDVLIAAHPPRRERGDC